MEFRQELEFRNKEDHFFQLLSDGWHAGAFDIEVNSFPLEASEFVKSQYDRFNITVPKGCEFLYTYGLSIVSFVLSYQDPYLLYWQFSDIERTDDWCKYTYEILDHNGNVQCEADPEQLETFRFVPYQADKFFDEYIQKPGLDAMPNWAMVTVKDVSEDFLNEYIGDAVIDPNGIIYSPKEVVSKLESICTKDGILNDKMFKAYLDLSMWAAVLWWFGPYSRNFRSLISMIQETCLDDDECIVYMNTVIDKSCYRRIERPAESCYKCGVAAWCVEHTLDDHGVPRVICEGCLSEGMQRYDGATCGTKFCKYFQCHHNAWYNDAKAQMGGMARSGQLGQAAQRGKEQRIQVAAQSDVKRIVNG